MPGPHWCIRLSNRAWKNRLYRLPSEKDYHVYITRSTYHYAYARQMQVNIWYVLVCIRDICGFWPPRSLQFCLSSAVCLLRSAPLKLVDGRCPLRNGAPREGGLGAEGAREGRGRGRPLHPTDVSQVSDGDQISKDNRVRYDADNIK